MTAEDGEEMYTFLKKMYIYWQNSQEIVQTHRDSCGMLKIASLELSRQVLNVENATDSQNLNSSRKGTV